MPFQQLHSISKFDMACKTTCRVKNEIHIACSKNMLQASLIVEIVDHDIFQCTIIHIFYFLNLPNSIAEAYLTLFL